MLEESMAGAAQKVNSFLEDLVAHSRPAAERELAELTASAKKLGFPDDKLQRWDVSYYAEKLKKEKFAIGDEQPKPYFKLENVIQGAFNVANRLYGLTFKAVTNIPVWNPEVKTYEVLDTDAFKEKGLLNRQVADSFRQNVLSKGGSEKADLLYRRFRGRDPKPDARLRRAGLIQ